MGQRLESLKCSPPPLDLSLSSSSTTSSTDDNPKQLPTSTSTTSLMPCGEPASISRLVNKHIWQGIEPPSSSASSSSLYTPISDASVRIQEPKSVDALTTSMNQCQLDDSNQDNQDKNGKKEQQQHAPAFDFAFSAEASPPVFAPSSSHANGKMERKILPLPTPRRQRLGSRAFQQVLQRSKDAVSAPRSPGKSAQPSNASKSATNANSAINTHETTPKSNALKRRPSYEPIQLDPAFNMATSTIAPAYVYQPRPANATVANNMPNPANSANSANASASNGPNATNAPPMNASASSATRASGSRRASTQKKPMSLLPPLPPIHPAKLAAKKGRAPATDFDVLCHLIPLPLNADDWVCLLCQYKIFVYGWKKVLRHRRRAQRRQHRALHQQLAHQHHEHHEHHHDHHHVHPHVHHTHASDTAPSKQKDTPLHTQPPPPPFVPCQAPCRDPNHDPGRQPLP